MRCKKHLSDVSSSVGVCASCLRERLLPLRDDNHRRHLTPADEDNRKQTPAPIVFPRSVSPYISRRKSDAELSGELRQMRFFSTPQVVPTANRKKSKFHALSRLFRSRSSKSERPTPDPKTVGLFSVNEASACHVGRRGRWFWSRNRGMSPDVREDESDAGSLSPEQWKGTPRSTRAGQGRVKASPARSHVASGIGICLSPLMRPSPSRHWNSKGAAEYSGEIRSTVKPHLSTAASLRANRSRKLVDLGRFNHKR